MRATTFVLFLMAFVLYGFAATWIEPSPLRRGLPGQEFEVWCWESGASAMIHNVRAGSEEEAAKIVELLHAWGRYGDRFCDRMEVKVKL